jgi:hypothetical protein
MRPVISFRPRPADEEYHAGGSAVRAVRNTGGKARSGRGITGAPISANCFIHARDL